MEEWKNFEHQGVVFEVSNMGSVRVPERTHFYDCVRNGKNYTIKRKLPAITHCQQTTPGGYLNMELRIDGKRVRIGTHRLVALTFVPGFQEGFVVNHINGIKTDNRAENLEWVTLAQNTKHAWETGLVNLRGNNQPTAKLDSKRVLYIRRLLKQGVSAHSLAIVAGVSPSLICLIRDGKRWASLPEEG